jgi:hypothetical protein
MASQAHSTRLSESKRPPGSPARAHNRVGAYVLNGYFFLALLCIFFISR